MNYYFLIVLAALMGFTSLSTDIYLPAMPQMQAELSGNVELTITGFLVGFAIAQIIWGPISDKYGRKLPLALGILFFIIGSIGCALSGNIVQIMIWRIVQALGACTGPMLARAMVRDKFERIKAAETLSTLMVIMAIAPIIGPMLGGQMIKFSSWHSIFWLLTVIGAVMLISLIWLPETLGKEKRQQISLGNSFSNYGKLLKNWRFMRYVLCITFFYVGVYAFIAGSPFVYINYFGIRPQHYGLLFALNIVGVMSLSFINRRLVQRYSTHKLLSTTTGVAMLAGLLLVLFSNLQIGGIAGIIVPVFFFFSMNGIISATATAAALDDVPEIAGAASALLGSLQYGSGILSTLLLAWFSDGTPKAMCYIIGVFESGTFLILFVGSKTRKSEEQPLVIPVNPK